MLACTASPFDLPASLWVALRQRRPLAVYLFDDPIYQWPPGPLRRVARFFEPLWSRVASTIFAPNEAMVDTFARRRGRVPVLIRNPVSMDAFGASDRPWPVNPAARRIVYTGSVYHAQSDAFVNLVQALELVRGWSLHIYTSQTAAQIAALGIQGPNVCVHDHLSQEGSYEAQRSSDLLFLPLAFRSSVPEVLKTSAPMKMGEYLASGRPVLVHAPADLFVVGHMRQHDAALIVDQPSPEMLANALKDIVGNADLRRSICANAFNLAQQYRADVACATFWQTISQTTRPANTRR